MTYNQDVIAATKKISSLAYDLRMAGDTEHAALELEKGLKDYPRSTELLISMGILLKERGEHYNALGYFKTAHEISPTSGYIANHYGRQLALCGDIEEAEKIMVAFLDPNTQDQRIFVNLGIVYLRLGQHQMGVTCLTHAANLPGATLETINKCRDAKDQHNVKSSEECWQQLLSRHQELKPYKDMGPEDFLKEAHAELKDRKSRNALRILHLGLNVHKNDPYLMNMVGSVMRRHISDAKPDDTMGYLESAFNAQPFHANFAIDYAVFLARQGDRAKAEALLLAAYVSRPDDAYINKTVLLELANFYRNGGDIRLAAGCFEGLLKLNSYDGVARRETADLRENHGFTFDGTFWQEFLAHRKDVLEADPGPQLPAIQTLGPQ